jgi:hypothetical protein
MRREFVVHPLDRVPGREKESSFVGDMRYSAPGYFEMMRIPIVRGRDFASAERTLESNAVVISSDLANSLWGPADPIGRKLMSISTFERQSRRDTAELLVVGVVDEKKSLMAKNGEGIKVYGPLTGWGANLLVRTAGPAAALTPAIRSLVATEAPHIPITSAETLAAIAARENGLIMKFGSAAAAGSLLTLLLSAIGLYAIVAFAVGQRRHEIGIRTALGATPGQVTAMFFGNGLRLSVLGLVLGLPLSLIALRIFALQTDISQEHTPLLAVLIALTVVVVSSLATWVPARRATSVDPLVALRSE